MLKVPVPEVVHCNVVAFATTLPLRVYEPVSQMVASEPALTTAWRLMLSTMASEAVVQGKADVAVMVRVTLPAVMSAALGVYTGFRRVVSLNVPLPLLVQRYAKAC